MLLLAHPLAALLDQRSHDGRQANRALAYCPRLGGRGETGFQKVPTVRPLRSVGHAHCPVVQLAERLTLDQEVGGSSPPRTATNQQFRKWIGQRAGAGTRAEGLSGGLKDSARRPFQGPIQPPSLTRPSLRKRGLGDIHHLLLTLQMAPASQGPSGSPASRPALSHQGVDHLRVAFLVERFDPDGFNIRANTTDEVCLGAQETGVFRRRDGDRRPSHSVSTHPLK